MFKHKAIVATFISIILFCNTAMANTTDRIITFNGVLVSQQELPILDTVLGFSAPDGHYVFNVSNGALVYSNGIGEPVLLGYVPVNNNAPVDNYSQGTFEDEVGNFCAEFGGCNF
jgi:hypothetical protein